MKKALTTALQSNQEDELELCAYLHLGPRGKVCTSMDGKSTFPLPHECGKGVCIHYRKSMIMVIEPTIKTKESLQVEVKGLRLKD